MVLFIARDIRGWGVYTATLDLGGEGGAWKSSVLGMVRYFAKNGIRKQGVKRSPATKAHTHEHTNTRTRHTRTHEHPNTSTRTRRL